MAVPSSFRSLLSEKLSLAESISLLPRHLRLAILNQEDPDFLNSWEFWARPKQILPDGLWRIWLILAGRGWGKTRTGAEACLDWFRSSEVERIALVARTTADVRDVMVEGESGLLACGLPGELTYEPSRRLLTHVPTGATAHTYSAEEAMQLRGPQHAKGWADELAQWSDPDAWDQLKLGMRLGAKPQIVVTTTPRPTDLIRNLKKDPYTKLTDGSTFENEKNLPRSFIDDLLYRYQGTRLGRQELEAELLDEVPGAYWTHAGLDADRVRVVPELSRIELAVDPSGGDTEGHDEQGIVVAGRGKDGHMYVLDDASCRLSPDGWGKLAVQKYKQWDCDALIWESNFGGQMVEHVVTVAARELGIHIVTREVKASRGKVARAEPVSALYEQHKVHHVGSFPVLEDQLCSIAPQGYMGSRSPDRADALVWVASSLMLGAAPPSYKGIPDPVTSWHDPRRGPSGPMWRPRR